jgi:hypothetical protein
MIPQPIPSFIPLPEPAPKKKRPWPLLGLLMAASVACRALGGLAEEIYPPPISPLPRSSVVPRKAFAGGHTHGLRRRCSIAG